MSTVDAATFGDLLRRLRLAAGLTQEELAERAGLSRRGITDLERGARTMPRRETLALLVEALDLAEGQRAELQAAARRGRATVLPAADSSPQGAGQPKVPDASDRARRSVVAQAST